MTAAPSAPASEPESVGWSVGASELALAATWASALELASALLSVQAMGRWMASQSASGKVAASALPTAARMAPSMVRRLEQEPVRASALLSVQAMGRW